ncbi:hypothetical protein A3C21_00370 [Candidatus Kaiserbacteria bacterium RIFCSPHIGHO2_02_FULL_59_21]|uniref:Uncharacterized protein n=2 Tax=Candidatus Kaiseribacteriota TaxID=1752734 RepID=A0A0G2AZ05_9BACT|nr:MAG: hypothetical protein UY98_C0025G0004 [Candidatus Kaiserbacteria bacterium GW2011_GWA2_58_9]OGG67618.1 MAG: hypothetical protein A3C21_00370 [Candidatus Kaiserbacteria bacterium RIFCSPHIGHO2_02_FULL_59_21]OGG80389.1 MAG: hypothetical protein A2952_01540 [Candidatus Kaiserbacteria bacterium RIFCSPLOWO2_01_FULL_59_34]OGG86309.1 MAG: hypothetical protein A3I47_04010 [Candidatus Kaiserbacteria bacterium RIFCSPLOWO2_02_FULL_59_19]
MSSRIAANVALAALFFARKTRASGLFSENVRMRARTASRQRRLTRFLLTARNATLRDTTQANEERLSRERGETAREKNAP